MANLKEFPLATGRMLFAILFHEDQEGDYRNNLHTDKNIHTCQTTEIYSTSIRTYIKIRAYIYSYKHIHKHTYKWRMQLNTIHPFIHP